MTIRETTFREKNHPGKQLSGKRLSTAFNYKWHICIIWAILRADLALVSRAEIGKSHKVNRLPQEWDITVNTVLELKFNALRLECYGERILWIGSHCQNYDETSSVLFFTHSVVSWWSCTGGSKASWWHGSVRYSYPLDCTKCVSATIFVQ